MIFSPRIRRWTWVASLLGLSWCVYRNWNRVPTDSSIVYVLAIIGLVLLLLDEPLPEQRR